MTERNVLQQINLLTEDIIKVGLCDDQNFPAIIDKGENTKEVCTGKIRTNAFLKNISYADMYNVLLQQRFYNLRMLDGALITMYYLFVNGEICLHRLAFFPSPDLEEFQNNPEVYMLDEIYADVIDKRIVPFPLRFDYDSSPAARNVEHPISHLTLGQYKNCRIPVSSALTPSIFIDFIIRNFYNTAFSKCSERISHYSEQFTPTLSDEEKRIVHISLPKIG
ncbi:hypothetical protein CAFE_34870 [Caprobacter fermentans]|uniref:DUF2290 domain-containing protein n=1 Tax=Caproicibacter fermentans TaxID=2576756 RepID=A0A6N8I5F2_9FIRM|nr:DUF2290 domain-containing protein [Caproicibacter fermentans]MVB12743.1 hypothetical protein [Caproicibacter fermentans]